MFRWPSRISGWLGGARYTVLGVGIVYVVYTTWFTGRTQETSAPSGECHGVRPHGRAPSLCVTGYRSGTILDQTMGRARSRETDEISMTWRWKIENLGPSGLSESHFIELWFSPGPHSIAETSGITCDYQQRPRATHAVCRLEGGLSVGDSVTIEVSRAQYRVPELLKGGKNVAEAIIEIAGFNILGQPAIAAERSSFPGYGF